MSQRKIIISSKFNTAYHSSFAKWDVLRETKEWIHARISIFMKYTLNSLKCQSDQDFLALYECTENSMGAVNEVLGEYGQLPGNIRFTFGIKQIIKNEIQGYEYLYLANMDSDDMIHRTFIQQLHEYIPNKDTQVLLNQKGYMYDTVNDRLAQVWFRCPTFFTYIMRADDYIADRCNDMAIRVTDLNYEVLDKPNYVITVHENNTVTKFEGPWLRGMIHDESEKRNILSEFMQL